MENIPLKCLYTFLWYRNVTNKVNVSSLESGDGWVGSERDYTYDELLERAFNQLREKNPEMATGEKKKFIMKPPQVCSTEKDWHS